VLGDPSKLRLENKKTKLTNSILKPMGFKENEDYALGYEQLTRGVRGSVSSLLNKDIPDLINADWLGSRITHEGNFVWYK
jgi:hypothetical protein